MFSSGLISPLKLSALGTTSSFPHSPARSPCSPRLPFLHVSPQHQADKGAGFCPPASHASAQSPLSSQPGQHPSTNSSQRRPARMQLQFPCPSLAPDNTTPAPSPSAASPNPQERGRSRTHTRCLALFGSSPPSPSSSSPVSPDARKPGPQLRESERSSLVNEEVVYFIFQLDLDTQLQRALNYEAYEQAQAVRAKRQKVDEAMLSMRERKAGNVGSEASEAALSMEDLEAESLRLRTAMARAVEKEDYKEAASCRDLLARLETKRKQAEALAAEFTGGKTFNPKLRLGQRIVHRVHGYRGVVVGWDAQCCEDEAWVASNSPSEKGASSSPSKPALNREQPFYHVLVDQNDWENDMYQPPVAYVAEEWCWTPDEGTPVPASYTHKPKTRPTKSTATSPSLPPSGAKPGVGGLQGSGVMREGAGTGGGSSKVEESKKGGEKGDGKKSSWVEVMGPDALQHPYMYILFLGQDGKGDYLPCRQLRDKYSVQRRNVYRPGEEPK